MEAHTRSNGLRIAFNTLSKGYRDLFLCLLKQGEGEGKGQTEGKPEREKKEKEKLKSEIVKEPCLKSGHGNAHDNRRLAFERVTIRNVAAFSGGAA